jgi:hypothetical protein
MLGGRPRPVTKADLRLSKRHARQSIQIDKQRIKEHGALARRERKNKPAAKEEQWHLRHHTQDLKKERRYLKSLNRVKLSKTPKRKTGGRHGK